MNIFYCEEPTISTANVPVAKKEPTTKKFHSVELVDEYAWLENPQSSEVIQFLKDNNEHVRDSLEHLEPLRKEIFQEIKSRVKETDMTLPVRKGNWWFFSRSFEGKNYSAQYRVRVTDASNWTPPTITEEPIEGEELILDINELAQGHEYFALGTVSDSNDGRYLAYAIDVSGDERYDLVIKDLVTGQLLEDRLDNISSGAFFSPDDNYIFYTTVDDAWRPDSIWRHRVGTDRSEDVRVFHEPDERFWIGIGMSRSKKYLLIEASSKITSEIYVLDAENPTGEFTSVLPRREGIEYAVEHVTVGGKDYFFFIDNDGAENFRLAYSAAQPQASLIPLGDYNEEIRIESLDAFDNFLVLGYRAGGLPSVSIARLDTIQNPEQIEFKQVTFDNPLSSVGISSNPEPQTPVVRLEYASFTEPSKIIEYDVATGDHTILREQEVLGDYNPHEYVSERRWAVGEDGVKIPLSVVYRRDVSFPAPTVLYGYGAYEIPLDPYFSIPRLSLLDRGVVFVIAHIRGGGELGRSWYLQGKELLKRNTFTDFVSSAKYLKDNNLATDIVAEGGSAGGLLMGAITNMAPELFAGVLASVAFVDTLNTILDPSLPLTIIEWEEWGNPLENKEVFDYMRSYSPYDNVTAQAYPEILAITSLNDTRVRYSEPAKWVAKLREHTTSGKPIYLKTELVAGHAGGSGRYKRWEDISFEHAWVLDTLSLV